MNLDKRTREWIHKPVFDGAPLSWTQRYFQGKLKEFRKEHKQFDRFLIGINKLMQAENDDDFANIEKFINGQAEANWIASEDSLFSVLIKLFNLCLSPRQAFAYIKECLAKYKEMVGTDYRLFGDAKLSIRRDQWDGKESKFISFIVEPSAEPEDSDYRYWFCITVSLKIIEGYVFDAREFTDEFELKCRREELKDALMLFEYHQCKGLLRKVFEAGIKQLEERGAIKEFGRANFCGLVIRQFETGLKVGEKEG